MESCKKDETGRRENHAENGGAISIVLDPERLGFQTVENSRHPVANDIEGWNRRLSDQMRDVADDWKRGDRELVIFFKLPGEEEGVLIFRSIPPHASSVDHKTDTSPVAGNNTVRNGVAADVYVHLDKFSMNLDVAKSIECPKGLVPACVTVGLETDEMGVQFGGDTYPNLIFGARTENIVFNVFGGISEREFCPRRIKVAHNDGGGINTVIQGGTGAIDCIESHDRDVVWNWVKNLDYVDILSGIRIMIDDSGERICVEVSRESPLEFTNVFTRPSDQRTRAVEWFKKHGRRS